MWDMGAGWSDHTSSQGGWSDNGENGGKNGNTPRKTCPDSDSTTTNPKWSDRAANSEP